MAFISTYASILLAGAAAPVADSAQTTSSPSARIEVVARARIISANPVRRSSKLDHDSNTLPKQMPDRVISQNATGQIMVEFM